jgi:hypothetical protein
MISKSGHRVIEIKPCETCEEEVYVTTKRPTQRYCSQLCWARSEKHKRELSVQSKETHTKIRQSEDGYPLRTQHINKICLVCKEEFIVIQSQSHHECCSFTCGRKLLAQRRIRRKDGRFIKKPLKHVEEV